MRKFLKDNWLSVIVIILLLMIYQQVKLTVDYADTANANAKNAYLYSTYAYDVCEDAKEECER